MEKIPFVDMIELRVGWMGRLPKIICGSPSCNKCSYKRELKEHSTFLEEEKAT
jgi:hypothetical protein